jgi:hypothetical protein
MNAHVSMLVINSKLFRVMSAQNLTYMGHTLKAIQSLAGVIFICYIWYVVEGMTGIVLATSK